MDRVNRSLLLVSTLIAVPAALLTATLVTGTTPDVALAVGQDVDSAGKVEPVVGKQPSSRRTRPGLFQVVTGSRQSGSRDHSHRNMPQQQPKGLLDAFFDRSGSGNSNGQSQNRASNQNRHTAHGHSTRTRSGQSRTQQFRNGSTDAGSDHAPLPPRMSGPSIAASGGNSGSNVNERQPIRDPEPLDLAPTRTRIIRGGASRGIPATTASVRRSSEPTLARRPVPATSSTTQTIKPIAGSNKRLFDQFQQPTQQSKVARSAVGRGGKRRPPAGPLRVLPSRPTMPTSTWCPASPENNSRIRPPSRRPPRSHQ